MTDFKVLEKRVFSWCSRTPCFTQIKTHRQKLWHLYQNNKKILLV